MIPGETTGSLGVGGPAITAGGLVFIGATLDSALRAFDSKTGQLVWEHALPAAANATPMTYQIGNTQYVVVAAGGQGMLGTQQDDTVVAFALPDTDKPAAKRSRSSRRRSSAPPPAFHPS